MAGRDAVKPQSRKRAFVLFFLTRFSISYYAKQGSRFSESEVMKKMAPAGKEEE